MDKKTFCETYGLSTGQLNRLLVKAARNRGRFEVEGCGEFVAKKKGKAQTSPIDILPARTAAKRAASPAPPVDQPGTVAEVPKLEKLYTLPKSELDRLKRVAEIEKLRQANERGRSEIRAEFASELIPLISEALGALRGELERLRLPADDLERLRRALDASLNSLAGVSNDCR